MEVERLRILLVGNGGREHALAWKLSQSPRVDIIYVVPGNGGTARDMRNVHNITSVKPEDFPGLVAFAKEHEVSLVVPGPEAPLVAGIEGFFRAAGIRCFGPTKSAARMEGSKKFSKEFMTRHRIPTAPYGVFKDYRYAREFLENFSQKVVLKASGLAAGKGVIIPDSKEEAHQALEDIMVKKEFGAAGDEVVIEEFLEGDELSFLSFSDGYTLRSLPPAQDHKQVYSGDCGPNTGGMGCYAPTKVATPHLIKEVCKKILQPTIDGMRKEGYPFVGVLFTGLIITKSGEPKVLEYNVRFGDPETQTLLPLMSADTDLAEIMVACTDHYLDAVSLRIEHKFSATVVAAAGGYPGPYVRGEVITLKAPPSDIMIFHAGTALASQDLITSGGRVIAATSTAATLDAAIVLAYTGIKTINFPSMHHRDDIGHRALKPSPIASASVTEHQANGGDFSYAAAGVDITAGNTLVKRITSHVSSTARTGAPADLGGFGGLFDLAAAGYTSPPTLIGAIDGVGTKLKIAHTMNKHDTVGIDLVAMNVNDLVVQGAEPLFFLDCYSCGKLDVEVAEAFVKGVAAGCREAGCALIGGETAEMPGMFASDGGYDAVGATVGAVKHGRRLLPDKSAMKAGDVLLGLVSNGCHSNGFSLVRKIIEHAGLGFQDQAPWAEGTTVGDSLLTPTRIYVKTLLKVIERDLLKGLSHITGGGLVENIPRMLPKHLAAEIDAAAWELPPVMKWLKKAGSLGDEEFSRVLNTGLGIVMVVSEEKAEEAFDELRENGETVKIVGRLVDRKTPDGCVLRNLEAWR